MSIRPHAKRNLARSLRKASTEAEQRLWHHLRRNQLEGQHFRRQHPIGPYVVDFVCLDAHLIVETDGSQHQDNEHDSIRDAFLARYGFRVLRFWNNETLGQTEAVLAAIIAALQESPTLRASVPECNEPVPEH